MLLLHGAIAAMLIGTSPVSRAIPVRTAVAATLISGPAQSASAQSTQSVQTQTATTTVKQAPNEQRPQEPRPQEPRPQEPPLKEQSSKHHERAKSPARSSAKSASVASANPIASPAIAAGPASRDAGSVARETASAPAAVIAPGAQCKTPEYPKASRRQNEEGVVSLRFLVDSDGHVLTAEVEKSSGYSRLDDAARNALALCQFRPGERDGQPVRSWARINYSWKLR